MDEPKPKKPRLITKMLGLTAATAVALPIGWGLMMYGRASHFAFKHYKTTLAAALLAGGMYYAATNEEAQQYVKDSFTHLQQQYIEHNVSGLEKQITELDQENKNLEQVLRTNGNIEESNKKLYLGLGAGAGVTLLGLAAYGFSQTPKKKPRVQVMR